MRAAWVLIALPACTPVFGEPAIPFAEVRTLFVQCRACHSGNRIEGQLDLTDVYESTVGVLSKQVDMNLIEPGDYLNSYLWHKCNGSQSLAGGAGSSMPLGATLSDGALIELAEWIDAGANP